jgi:methyl-accepting chemotaxis protein
VGLAGLSVLVVFRRKVRFVAFRHWGLSTRVTLVSVASVALMGVVVLAYLLPTIRDRMYNEKLQATKQVVDVAYSVLASVYGQAQRGEITEDAARKLAVEKVAALRYNQNDYFWLNDLTPVMIMHPFKPELNGKDISAHTDPTGRRLFVDMVQVCRERGEGAVHYLWPKPGVDKPVAKISYVKLFAPWGWVVGSGIYVEDVEAELDGLRAAFLIGILLAFTLSAILGAVIGRVIRKPVRDIAARMENADIRTQFGSDLKNEIGDLQRAFDRFVASIREALVQVSTASVAVAGASAEISSSTEEMAAGAQAQTGQASEVASAVDEMTKTIFENSRNASSTVETAKQARTAAETGGKVVEETISGMKSIAEVVRQSAATVEELGRSSNQIGEIVAVINDIADQTNLLALNAAIEAARAGDQGRGFAVVADEVRKLAERTTKATKEIAVMISSIQRDTSAAVQTMTEGTARVDAGILLADRAGDSLREIVDVSQKVTDMVLQIASASEQQSSAAEEITRNVEAITRVTGETASGTQLIARSAEDLQRLTTDLQTLVKRFDLSVEEGSARPEEKPRERRASASSIAVGENGRLVVHGSMPAHETAQRGDA